MSGASCALVDTSSRTSGLDISEGREVEYENRQDSRRLEQIHAQHQNVDVRFCNCR